MIQIFFAYSHKDEAFRDELEIHLAMLKRQGLVEAWHDRRIGAGKDLHGEISDHIEGADIVLLLVSPYFLASDYCYDVEMSRALERHKHGHARVIPVIVHPCEWQEAPFGRLLATPPDGKPISKFANIHEAFLAVTHDIRVAAAELGRSVKASNPATPSVATTTRRPDARSSNLRIKREFSDRDRDKFLDDTFEYIANFFENSLNELASRHPVVETNFRRVDANRITAAVYVDGEKQGSCRIWRGDNMIGDIAYASGDSGGSNSYNEALSVADDGYALFLKVSFSISGHESLTAQGAAEHLWAKLVGGLQ